MKNTLYLLLLCAAVSLMGCQPDAIEVQEEESIERSSDRRNGKVKVCHCTGNDGSKAWKVLNVNKNALRGHLRHGDFEMIDADRDGFYAENPCVAAGAVDCDDDNSAVYPGATEICDDGIDNNCNGLVDCDDDGCDGVANCATSACPELDEILEFINSSGLSEEAIFLFQTDETMKEEYVLFDFSETPTPFNNYSSLATVTVWLSKRYETVIFNLGNGIIYEDPIGWTLFTVINGVSSAQTYLELDSECINVFQEFVESKEQVVQLEQSDFDDYLWNNYYESVE